MSENKSKLPSRPKILAVSLVGILIALPAYAADNPPAEVTESSNIEALTVTGKRSADQKGADDVYYKNVSNAYVGKEYLERYRVQSAGDVLKGLNGVYNMNTRTAGGAITPNIRGITGKGRIPVTVDGTEQTIDVWMNNYGVGDRNYLDPALFRSIAVEKSPALTRGVKSGVGGAMSIRTIEPSDIIPEGRNWGIEVKTEFSGNTVAQKNDLRQFLGRDYRTLSPIGATADGVSGMPDVLTGYTGNDIDGQLINLYRVVQHHFDEFVRQFDWILTSREVFARLQSVPPESMTDIQRAARFFYLQHIAFGGKTVHQHFGTTTTSKAWDASQIRAKLTAARNRLSGVFIENEPWERCFKRYDREHTFFYADPPYWQTAGYDRAFDWTQYQLLAKVMSESKGKIMLSINDHPDIRNLFKDFRIAQFELAYSIGRSKTGKTSGELAICNW